MVNGKGEGGKRKDKKMKEVGGRYEGSLGGVGKAKKN